MATLYDRDKHWNNVPDEHRPDILVYLGHVLYSYVDAGKKPPDYHEAQLMLQQQGYKNKLIAEQKGQIRSMLWQTHTLYEKPWGQGSLNFPGMPPIAYGPNKQDPPKGGKRRRRKTSKTSKTNRRKTNRRKTKGRKTKRRATLKKRN